jgi:uncharacterized protein
MKQIVIDTGPLVALFDRSDQFHEYSLEFIKEVKGPLYTILPVVTEASFLLDFNVCAQLDFLAWVAKGAVRLVPMENSDLLEVCQLMGKYRDLPMDFTDGCLVALCDKLNIQTIATLDRDFEIYRYKKRYEFLNIFSL